MTRHQYVIIPILAVLLLSVGCSSDKRRSQSGGPQFVTLCSVRTTPVKNQGSSSMCWAYGMLATIESEHIMKGDSINLSPNYVLRSVLRQEGAKCFFSRGKKDIDTRGTMPMLIHYIELSGIIPYDSYYSSGNKPVNAGIVVNKLQHMARAANNYLSYYDRMTEIFDDNIGYLPKIVAMGGTEYTPREFAHSVCLPDEYVALTSFTHHPYYTWFALEVPDNRMNDRFYNIPLDSLMEHIETALFKGHPVCWEGDISEQSFDWERGVAELHLSAKEQPVQLRQHMFESLQTTDDHVMELVGVARDFEGNRYFIAKNSWGTGNAFKGYMYLSEDYVRMKTIAVSMSRAAYGASL